jgi:hypothetical protein
MIASYGLHCDFMSRERSAVNKHRKQANREKQMCDWVRERTYFWLPGKDYHIR